MRVCLRECARARYFRRASKQGPKSDKQPNNRRRLWTGTILVIFEFDKLEARAPPPVGVLAGTRGYPKHPGLAGGSGTRGYSRVYHLRSQRLNKKVPDVALKLMRVVATASISKLQVLTWYSKGTHMVL